MAHTVTLLLLSTGLGLGALAALSLVEMVLSRRTPLCDEVVALSASVSRVLRALERALAVGQKSETVSRDRE